ncbi:MAG: hypothetical protein JNM27_11995 [Leptospirales bacterium]|nr:hypothetical protein [Leptospirales bacterium]
MSESVLKKLSEKLAEWDGELASLKAKASSSAGEQKQNFDRLSADLATQTAQIKAKIEELKNKSPDEIKAQADDLLRSASGKISDGLKNLAAFFESKAKKTGD